MGLKYIHARIRCVKVDVDDSGAPILLHCEALAEDENPEDKPKGTIQWVPASSAVPVEVRLYNHLFTVEEPNDDIWEQQLNPHSEIVVNHSLVDPSILGYFHAKAEDHFQFERLGFFVVDKDSDSNKLVFNLTVALKDSKPAGTANATSTVTANRSRKEEQAKQLAEKMVCLFVCLFSICIYLFLYLDLF